MRGLFPSIESHEANIKTSDLAGLPNRRPPFRSRGVLIGMLFCSAAVATPAIAQTAPEAPNVSATESTGVDDIIVTAQRRSESLQRVPVSVTAVTGDTLKTRQINDLTQLTIAAPSLQTGNGGFTIRGIGTLTNAPSIEGSVAIAIDDVSIGETQEVIDVFNDVARVEVLNGPQGLLFGRNASAGLLNVVTNKPQLDKLSTDFSLEAGSRDRVGAGDSHYVVVRDAINIPIGVNSALRINGIYSHDPMVTTNIYPATTTQADATEQYGVRAKFLTNLTDRLSVYLIGEYLESHGSSISSYRSVGAGPSLAAGQLAAAHIVAGPDNFLIAADAPNYLNRKQTGAQGTISYDLGGGWTVSNIAAWKKFDHDQATDADASPADLLDHSITNLRYTQFSDELRVALPAGDRLSGQAGLYFFSGKLNSFGATYGALGIPAALQVNFPFCVGAGTTPGCTVRNLAVIGSDTNVAQSNKSYAGFGQLTYRLFDGLNLIGGARVTHDDLRIISRQNMSGNTYRMPLVPTGSFDQSTSNTNFSWKGGAQYQATSQIMAYATYGRGYKGPGANPNSAVLTANLIVRPETSDALEAGVKASFLGRRLVLDVSLFHTKFHDFQVQSYDPSVTAFVIQNAAEVTSKGAEISVIAKPFKGLTLNASASFVDSKFDSFPGAQCYPGQTTTGCTTGRFDAAGYRTPATARFASSIQGRYELPVGDAAALFVDGSLYHRASINYSVNAAPGAGIGAIDILGGSFGVRNENFQLSVFCKNCSNVHYPTFIGSDPIDATRNVDSYRQSFGANSVRSIGLTFGSNF